ncbi:MAG: L-threonylcarbamoyladenylate synthase [Pseudomonadota bacterium]
MAAKILFANDRNIKQAAYLIMKGQLVAFATETVYGLGANAYDQNACSNIFTFKKRNAKNPLIIHIRHLDELEQIANINDHARALANHFWPGPLSLILPLKQNSQIATYACANLDTICVRAPSHPVAQKLLSLCQCPIAAPSANPSGYLSPTSAQHVQQSFKSRDLLILDSGPCQYGIESTIIALTQNTALMARPGAIATSKIESIIGPIESIKQDTIKQIDQLHAIAPGMAFRHYAPKIPLRLSACYALEDETLIGFGGTHLCDLDLSPTGDLLEAAHNLFAFLYKVENNGAKKIAVAPIPKTGIGEAINDRLKRAAQGVFKT